MGRAAKNYPRELKDRAIAMVREVRGDYPSEYAPCGTGTGTATKAAPPPA